MKAAREQGCPDGAVQRQAAPVRATEVAPPIVHEVLRAGGRPLEPTTRELMEQRFGHDFGTVRVHADPRAAESARQVDAKAYTVGEQIVLGAAAPSLGTAAGRSLLAHELTHTLQQRGGAPQAPAPAAASAATLEVAPENSSTEHQADAMTAAVPDGAGAAAGAADLSRLPAPLVQRQGTSTSKPTSNELDADAEKVVSVVMPNPRDKRDSKAKAVELVYRILNQYFPNYASKVSGVGFDNAEAKGGLETEQKTGRDKTFYGFIWVGDRFVEDLIRDKRLLASKVAKVAHELQHIDQWRAGLAGNQHKNEREFLAHHDEAAFVAKPGTGMIPHTSRARHIDVALGLYNCLDAELQKKYLAKQKELLEWRPREIRYGHRETNPDPPARCMQPEEFGFDKDKKQ